MREDFEEGIVKRPTKPRHEETEAARTSVSWFYLLEQIRVIDKVACQSKNRPVIYEGKPRLPQSGRRGSHTPTRFARLIQILDETDGAPVVPIEAFGGIHEAAAEVQVVGGNGIAGRT